MANLPHIKLDNSSSSQSLKLKPSGQVAMAYVAPSGAEQLLEFGIFAHCNFECTTLTFKLIIVDFKGALNIL